MYLVILIVITLFQKKKKRSDIESDCSITSFIRAICPLHQMEYNKKVIVIGDVGVGKTSFVARVTEGRFITEYKSTVGGKYIVVSAVIYVDN